tara:strand:- start:530 stop:775 length:246 start_codon:yes stop_codon:yes gene_type:complete
VKRRSLQLISERRLLVRPKTNGEVPAIAEASLDTNSKDVSDQAVPPAREEPGESVGIAHIEEWVCLIPVPNAALENRELTV